MKAVFSRTSFHRQRFSDEAPVCVYAVRLEGPGFESLSYDSTEKHRAQHMLDLTINVLKAAHPGLVVECVHSTWDYSV